MKVSDILKRAGVYLSLSETESLPTLSETDARAQTECNTLLFCLNEVLSELATDYFPQIIEEEYQLVSGKINFDELSKSINKLHAVKNSRNEYLKFTLNCQSATVETGQRKVIVRYSYLPSTLSAYTADIDFEALGVTSRLIALGVATEYCLYKGKLSEANMFDARYRDAIKAALTPARSLSIKPRTW